MFSVAAGRALGIGEIRALTAELVDVVVQCARRAGGVEAVLWQR